LSYSISFVYRQDVSSTRPSEIKPKLSFEELADLVSTLQTEVVAIKTERDTQVESLQETIVNLAHENELLKRRLYGTKTERLRTSENQLALGDLLNDNKQLQKQLDAAVAEAKSEGRKPNPRADATCSAATCQGSLSTFATPSSSKRPSTSAGMSRHN
jgi:transposase IS166 family protein